MVMHPLAIAPGLNNSRTSQIRKMTRYLRLPLLSNLHKVANAHLTSIHQVQQA